jgi:L-asparagine oxygenase
MPVFSGSPGDPDMCVDFHAMEPLTERAAEAFDALRNHMLSSLVGAVLERGDMVIVDNRKAVHGRTEFTPRYDGKDRWLRRCFTVADIRSSQSLLLPGSRVHRPLTEELLAA